MSNQDTLNTIIRLLTSAAYLSITFTEEQRQEIERIAEAKTDLEMDNIRALLRRADVRSGGE